MGPNQTYKLLHSKGNHKQNENTTLRMGENICKRINGQRINLQNIQTAHAAQYQENKRPNHKMGRRPKQTFLQRRHIDGQEAHENMLNITNYQRNANQNYSEVSPHTGQNDHRQKIYKQQMLWRGCGEKGTLLYYWWECKLIQSLWRTVWRFLKELKVDHMTQQSHYWAYTLRKP